MKLFDKKSLILLISVVSINLLCIISVSYAYFTANIIGNDKAEEMTVTAGTMKITYTDSNIVTLNNAIPGDSLTKQFKVENTGNLDTKYNIKIDIENNDFEDYNDLKYTLTKNGVVEPEKVLPYEDGYIVIENEIKEKGIDNYTLTLNFKKDESNQNDNANKKVKFKIEVDSETDVKLYEYQEPYRDESGANRPKLYQGLIPMTFNEDNTMKIADITKEWYNYDEHKWGNAVLIDNTNEEIRNKFYKEDGTLRINQTITEEDILQMYVWIPRYKYQLFNAVAGESAPKQIINIEFEKGVTSTGNVSCKYINEGNGTIREDCENAINGNWYTHPAFTFGETELPGIWVGKFELSDPQDPTGRNSRAISEITILPNKTSKINNSISQYFYASRDIELQKASKYNLNQDEIDTHIMKNMEWGAVAYLTQSMYGIYKDESHCNIEGMLFEECKLWKNNLLQGMDNQIYPNGGTATGCVETNLDDDVEWNSDGTLPVVCPDMRKWNRGGTKVSTTGNVYGIYDMSGGDMEYVMGCMVNQNGIAYFEQAEFQATDSPIKNIPIDDKYYEEYSYSVYYGTMERGRLGDATKETILEYGSIYAAWNSNYSYFPQIVSDGDAWSWMLRGGLASHKDFAGVFSIGRIEGGGHTYISSRSVLTAQDGI